MAGRVGGGEEKKKKNTRKNLTNKRKSAAATARIKTGRLVQFCCTVIAERDQQCQHNGLQ